MNTYQHKPQIIKFGGSNQKSPEDDLRIYETLKELEARGKVAAVFSARYGRSNSLLARVLEIPPLQKKAVVESNLNKLLRSDTLPSEVEAKLRQRHDNARAATMLLRGEHEAVQAHLGKIAEIADVQARLQHYRNFPIVAMDTSSYLTGEIDLEASRRQIQRYPLTHNITLIAGYAAQIPTKHDTTDPILLGRDASDLVAAALAQITAGYLHLAKDVSGIRTNPSDEGSTIENISREELMNLPSLPIHPKVLDLYQGEIRVGGFHPDEAQTIIQANNNSTRIYIQRQNSQQYHQAAVAK